MNKFMLLSAATAVVLLAGCETVREQYAKNPEAGDAVVEASCKVGEILLSQVPVVSAFSGVVANAACRAIESGVKPASAPDFGDPKLNACFVSSEVTFDNPAQQAEWDRIRAEAQCPGASQ